jgi:predicted nucleic acid-binding protein
MDSTIIVVNSTPIILLQKIGHLDLLQRLYGKVFMAQAVYKEIIIEENDNTNERNFLLINNWVEVIKVQNIDAKKMFATSLHAGEVETIILAMEKSADLCIFDDLLARKYAKMFDLNVTGTLGVLIAAKKGNYIDSAKLLLDELVSVGMYVSEELYSTVLSLAGE